MDQLRQSRPSGILPSRWDSYCEGLDRLEEHYGTERQDNHSEYMKRWRSVVADMLEMFEGMD